jgi:hypothetical protein
MPTMIMIFSDMEFNQGTSGNYSLTAQEIAENKYAIAGYKIPKLFIGIYLVEMMVTNQLNLIKWCCFGVRVFTIFVIKSIRWKDTPYSMMMNVIDSERYQSIII